MRENLEQRENFAIKELPHVRGENFFSFYTNNITAAVSFFDVSLTFSQVAPNADRTQPVLEDHATATMAWEHAKALHRVLGRLVSEYEDKSGSIRDSEKEPEL